MIQCGHEHIITELQQNTRTDTIFTITAILLNLVVLAINSGMAGGDESYTTIVMTLFVAVLVVVNLVVIFGLLKGKQMRSKLISGLLKMYKDQGVEGYYDPSLLRNYNTRYNFFMLVVVFMGLIAIAVPFVIR